MGPRKQRILTVFRERLSRLSVAKHPALLFNPWVEGYRDYTFGGRAGPAVSCANVFHELGHAAQFGVERFRTRATAGGFHFKVPRRFIYDRYCDEPKTSGATLRELETFAHQLHLMRLAGYKVTDEEFMGYSGRLMQYMHDWWHVPGANGDERAAYCNQVIQERFARLSGSEVTDKLEAWLDATQRRFKRQGSRLERAFRIEQRYRADGTVLTT